MTDPVTERFTLTMDQVPNPAQSGLWVDILRWCVCVMDADDKRLSFIASCLSHAIRNGGLSEKQSIACRKITSGIMADWANGVLVCQNSAPEDSDPAAEAPAMPRRH